jgi:Adenosine-deaminase (editase) domain
MDGKQDVKPLQKHIAQGTTPECGREPVINPVRRWRGGGITNQPTKTRHGTPSSLRHAEKRRTSTCEFADRIARFCMDHYQDHVPSCFREQQKQTCMAAIVAFVSENDKESGVGTLVSNKSNKLESIVDIKEVGSSSDAGHFIMLGMGVGTKFLPTEVLEEEAKSPGYGSIVRDCHAEVLARRAFRRQLLLSILNDIDNETKGEFPLIVQRVSLSSGTICYELGPGVSLHMYTSSAPCGNATVRSLPPIASTALFQPQAAHSSHSAMVNLLGMVNCSSRSSPP